MLIGDTILRLPLQTGPPFQEIILATRRSSRLQGQALFLSYFKTVSIGPAPGIVPTTFCSTVKRYWAIPAAIKCEIPRQSGWWEKKSSKNPLGNKRWNSIGHRGKARNCTDLYVCDPTINVAIVVALNFVPCYPGCRKKESSRAALCGDGGYLMPWA